MIFDAKSENITLAAEKIRQGGLVAFPTETVYGLGADARNDSAVEQIFAVKNRPHNNPLIVHVYDFEQIEEIAEVDSCQLAYLEKIKHFWPGPLSVLFEKKDCISNLVSGGGPTIAIRIPQQEVALQFLKEANVPVAAPSANRFSTVSPTTAKHVEESLGEDVEVILDGGACEVGIESTVIRIVEKGIEILRPGGITKEALEEAIGELGKVTYADASAEENKPSPGLLEKHYSPKTALKLASKHKGQTEERIGYISFKQLSNTAKFDATISLSQNSKPEEIASNLYAALRSMDKLGLDLILIDELSDNSGLSKAIMDRVKRALS